MKQEYQWVCHGRPGVYHLTAAWRFSPQSETRHDPICGIESPEVITRPDGFEYCRHCIGLEAIQ